MRIAVVGATGAVGQIILRTIERRGLPASEIVPFASERSADGARCSASAAQAIATSPSGRPVAASTTEVASLPSPWSCCGTWEWSCAAGMRP